MREELENGIYGLVVSLCQETARAEGISIPQAQDKVALWLVQVATSLQDLNQGDTKQHGS